MLRSTFVLRRSAYKIREAQGQKIPYMLVVGQKEQADGTVSVRTASKANEGAEDLNVFIANIKLRSLAV